MRIAEVFVSVLLLSAQSSEERKDTSDLIVQNNPQFPIQLEKPFEITIGPKNKSGNLINSSKDALVVKISSSTTSATDMAVFYFGSEESIEDEFVGEFITIPVWLVDIERGIINITIFFTKYAHQATIEIYYLNATTSEDQERINGVLKSVKPLYKSDIRLLVSPIIELSINAMKHSVLELYRNTKNIARCRAYYGIPLSKPEFRDFSDKSMIFSESKNEIEMTFKAQLKHHNKNLTCESGGTKRSIQIKVLHGPTDITFSPPINGSLGNGTSVICIASDGYPEPIISWHWGLTPKGGKRYFQIQSNGQVLYMKPDAPIGSKWKFTCQAKNTIKDSDVIYPQHIAFTIENKHEPGQPNTTPKPKSTDSPMTFDSVVNICQTIVQGNNRNQNGDILKLKIANRKHKKEISELRNAHKRLENKIEAEKKTINKLKEDIKKLNETNKSENNTKESTEAIKKLKDVMDKEIQSLKNDLLAIKSRLAKQKDNETTVCGTTNSASPPSKPVTLVSCTFYQVKRMRIRRIMSKSIWMNVKGLSYQVALWLWYGEIANLKAILNTSEIHTSGTLPPMNGVATMVIYNAKNRSMFQFSKQRFKKGRERMSLEFNFSYKVLDEYKVLKSDELFVECSLTFDN